MADISHITMPSGTVYYLKDAEVRSQLDSIKDSMSGAMEYIGTTTSELSDGATTSPIIIGTKSVTPLSGNVAIYGEEEFIWSDTDSKWHEFGSTGSLKGLAFKSSASGSVKPAGTVSKPDFTGDKGTATGSYTPSGTVKVMKGSGTANYTPSGSVSAPDVNVALSTTSIKPIDNVGTLPTCTMPKLSMTVENENLTFSWTDGSFSAGTLPTYGSAMNVATGVKSASATAPTFSGDGVDLEGEFTGDKATIESTYTPTGQVSQPTFSGTSQTVTVQ